MTKFFSAKTGGFYDSIDKEAHESKGAWPNDAVELTDKEYADVMTYRPVGKVISVGPGGRPVLVDLPPMTPEQLRSKKVVEAKAYLRETDWMVMRKLETGTEVPAEVSAKRRLAYIDLE